MFLRRLGGSGAPTDPEQLLDAAREARPATSSGPSDPLVGLLRAAAAPPRERELAGEQEALAAFRAARQAGAPAAAPRPRRRRFTAGVVVWIAGVAATATAGAALAAVRLDQPDERPAPPPAPITGPVAPSPRATGGQPDRDGASPSRGESEAPSVVTPGAGVGPTDGLAPTPPAPESSAPVVDATVQAGPGNSDNTADRSGLCKAYLQKSERQREKALRTPAFNELVVAAGGAENVMAYCQGVLAETDPQWLAKHGPSTAPESADGQVASTTDS
ncbi:hypothetical protein E0H26_22005 [Micromonospora zingiberis]|uniref:Uncharacterized protein n=1 Tax=Micromonospora zingiberis TaxID=2053011 RepID=A0A4R0GG39_9ACTN|nr:hypothetical protein [Micromonospora zingiberis]TCB94359.1 hypothetical protein E0H26_22005 [Micromonospora zingiberis]